MRNPILFLAIFATQAVSASPNSTIYSTDEMSGLAKPQPFNLGTMFEQAIGFYSSGSLRDATELSDAGPGFLKIFRPRNRPFGTELLVDTISEIASDHIAMDPHSERIQIGDMSNERGGQAGGHASHQNGLDVDIAYLRVDHREQNPNDVSGFMESFVDKRGRLTANFDVPRNFALIESFVATGLINRIFVDQTIKRALCGFAEVQGWMPEKTEVLRRLRHWPAHDDHMHVRLKCPEGASQCVAQEEVPEGSGCAD